jgi:hypothetical protein
VRNEELLFAQLTLFYTSGTRLFKLNNSGALGEIELGPTLALLGQIKTKANFNVAGPQTQTKPTSNGGLIWFAMTCRGKLF